MTDSPREIRYERVRQSILDAAHRLITTEGADNVSMRGIAREVDYTVGALYKYFESKEVLLATICEVGFERLVETMHHTFKPEDPFTERLYSCGQGYIQFARDNPEVYMLMFNQIQADPNALFGTVESNAFGVIYGLVQEGIKSGLIAPREAYTPQAIAFQLWYVVHGIASLRLTVFNGMDEDFDRMNDQVLRAAVHQVVNQT
ncbi:MAG: TetR/AcrR family transcriptional regulator [Anaerolineae bacterium]